MVDWGFALKIFSIGLGAVFASLAMLTIAVYAFGKLLKKG